MGSCSSTGASFPLPSAWLLGAALYTALTLFLSRPAVEDWLLPPHVNETVVAKQPPKSARLVFQDELRLAEHAAAQAAKPEPEWRNEWVQIAGYTTVGRAHPSSVPAGEAVSDPRRYER